MDRYTFYIVLLKYIIDNDINSVSNIMIYSLAYIRQDYRANRISKIEYDNLQKIINSYLDNLVTLAHYSTRNNLLNSNIEEYNAELQSNYIENLFYKDIINENELKVLLETNELIDLVKHIIKNESTEIR